jgi:transcriptional regulator with GAF, ATPase, and Fis domain
LFLDEIGDLPLESQVKLLRVLQERKLERVGGTESIKIDIRLVAATNKELRREVDEGRFRRDLYYRLRGYRIRTPALREHPTDIPIIIRRCYLSPSSQAGLLPPSPLGTDREGLPSISSSLSNAPFRTRFHHF